MGKCLGIAVGIAAGIAAGLRLDWRWRADRKVKDGVGQGDTAASLLSLLQGPSGNE
jgi:hypothetical protein